MAKIEISSRGILRQIDYTKGHRINFESSETIYIQVGEFEFKIWEDNGRERFEVSMLKDYEKELANQD